MSDTEIPDDVKQQALDAGAAAREAMNTPTDAEPVETPTPDAPEDSTNIPDAYDTQAMETFRADAREAAIADRDAPGEPTETEASGSISDLSQEDYDAALQAGQTINDAMDAQTVQESDPDAALDEAAPDQDTSLDLTSEPDTPEPEGPDPE